MLSNETYTYLFIGSLSIILTIWTFHTNAPSATTSGTIDYFNYITTLLSIPLFSMLTWAIFVAMSFQLNNCSSIFNSCFTNPTFSATTTSIYPFNFGFAIAYLGLGFMLLMFITTAMRMFIFVTQVLRKASSSKSGGILRK